jgi:hypothetical protein
MAWYGVSPASASGAAGDQVESVERNRQAGGGHDHELGESAVAPEPRSAPLPLLLAEMFGPDAARGAAAAAPRPVDENGRARLEAVGSRAERGHGARDLVTEREGQRVRERPSAPVHEVQVGMTEAGAADAHQHLTWTRFRDTGMSTSWAGCSQAVSRIACMRGA